MSELFDQIGNLWEKHNKVTTKTKPVSAFMTSRFLSLTEVGFFYAHELNSFGTLPEWVALPFYYHALPKARKSFNKYPKAAKQEKLSAAKEKALERICAKFCTSKMHGLQIMQLLEDQGIKLA